MYGAGYKLESKMLNLVLKHGFHGLFILLHTQSIVCHSIKSMFRVLGIYNFGLLAKDNGIPVGKAADFASSMNKKFDPKFYQRLL